MSHLINNEQKMIDIIFADRNKAYGAYAIRSSYGHTILKSLSLMLLGISSVMALAFYSSNRNNPEPEQSSLILHDSVYVIPVSLKEEKPEAPPEASEPTEPPAQRQDETRTSTTIVDSSFVSSVTSSTPVSSAAESGSTTTETTGGTGSIIGTGSVSTGIPGTDTAFVAEPYLVDSAPEFEGGISALYRFVSQHLKYPDLASAEGREGTVYVRFIVDETGKVGFISLLNTAGYGMDDEAMRVVSLIPKFKTPAKVKGKPVKTYYQLPIRFKFRY